MEFFTLEDLNYYSSVIGKKFKRDTSEIIEVKNKLTKNGVFDKTKHWADLISEQGYVTEFRSNWQMSGTVRTYSWAKIYLPGFENTNVYFTIGVDGFKINGSYKCELEYKLDCHRINGLSQYQIELFDNYISKNSLNRKRKIRLDQLKLYNWKKLIEETVDFIKLFEDHYKNIVDLIWPNGVGIEQKITRLCWNDNKYEKPSGASGKSTNKAQAFESEKGYGHEEWLFDLDKSIGGYHYGFIQAFNNVEKHKGKIYDVHLYSIKKVQVGNKWKSEFYWIGRIKRLEVLTQEKSDEIYELYEKKGWYQEMLNELGEIGVVKSDLGNSYLENLFNVRYKISSNDYVRFEEPISIEDPEAEIGKGLHYNLLELKTKTTSLKLSSGEFEFKSGHNPTKTGALSYSQKKSTVERSLLHKEIQENMFEQFSLIYGKDNVSTENPTGNGTSVDVVVKESEENLVFYEVKTFETAIKCIREALGQIIEYSMYPSRSLASKLIIVGPPKPGQFEIQYLHYLRLNLDLNLYYQSYDCDAEILLKELY